MRIAPGFHRLLLGCAICAVPAWGALVQPVPPLRELPPAHRSAFLATSASPASQPIRTRDSAGTATLKRAVASKPLPARPKPAQRLADYLAAQLGNKFHPRREWAGRSGKFSPVDTDTRTWESIGRVEYITIHHAEGVPDEHAARMIRNIFVGHTDPNGRLGAPDVGYHFLVDERGEVWEGRDARRQGTHVGSRPRGLNNSGNIGICGLGTFSNSYPPTKMVDGIVKLSVLITRYYDRPLTVRGHRDWVGLHGYRPVGGTDCPGLLADAVRKARAAVKALNPAPGRNVHQPQLTAAKSSRGKSPSS